MNQQLHETLSAKTTDELKDYVINMSNGYTTEAVEIAIHILRERGEDVDKLLRAAQVRICETCQHRKQSPTGLICNLTAQKANFIGNCTNYIGDPSAIEEAERTKQVNSAWGGMMNFYWFVLATGAALTTILAFVGFDTEIWLLSLSDVILMLGYSGICVYTIVAFAKRLPNAVALGKIQNYTLLAMNLMVLLSNLAFGGEDIAWYNSTARMVGSIIWAIIFLTYLYSNEQIKAVYPKQSRHMLKYDKPIMWSILGVVVALWIAGFCEIVVKAANRPLQELQTYVQNSNNTVVEDKTADHYTSGFQLSDSTVIINYRSNTYTNADLVSSSLRISTIFTKELVFHQPTELDQKLIELCYAADYGISVDWYDLNNQYTYSIPFSTQDVNRIYETIYAPNAANPYRTPDAVWSDYVDAWNEQLPAPYLQEDILCTRVEVDGNNAIINLVFQGWTATDLKEITNDYLKGYLTEIFADLVDQYILLAMLNQKDICFRFTSDGSLFWQEDVIFTAEEYNQ